jgi:putative tryptophan/tyrosine transport system substrate-binding protein
MKKADLAALALLSIAVLSAGCSKPKAVKASETGRMIEGRELRIFIVIDTLTPKMAELKAGLVEQMDAALSEKKSSAEYETLETRLDATAAAAIKDRVEKEKPDLVFCINNPSGFADAHISSKLKEPEYRFVSENAVPVQTGVIESWNKPGGNISGVGVFVQLNSSLKLLKKVKPSVKKIYSYSWDKMIPVNAWWEEELKKACAEEGFELSRFTLLKSYQAELAYADANAAPRDDRAFLVCISPYVNDDGTLVDLNKAAAVYADYLQNRFNNVFIAYEDSLVRAGALMGACVIWKDLGAQMADLGVRVLDGEDPGSIPWQYPRKFNIVINKKTADRLGIKLPQEIIDAAYRIYTDYQGNFMGH